MSDPVPIPPLVPLDEHNRRLEASVHPRDWINPPPRARYHLVVIGGGTAGLVTASVAAGLGARVALIERSLLGGDCLNVGCVPSKALIASARAAAAIRDSARFGIRPPQAVDVDFPAVMERMRRLRASISPHDSAERFRNLGVDVFLGDARLTAADTVTVDGRELRFRKAVIATGARAAGLDVPGYDSAGCLTNETVFSLTELPRRLAVIGGGPIGCELAQCFARFGSEVTLIESSTRLLGREDPEAAAIVQSALERDGVRLMLGSQVTRFEREGHERRLFVRAAGGESPLAADQVLVAVGRLANVENLGLEAAGVAYDLKRGVHVDDHLRTTNPKVFAAGDVCTSQQFTHAADFMARIVVRNALFLGWNEMSHLIIPRCTYTSPELAHVGFTPQEAAAEGLTIRTDTVPLSQIDRSIVSDTTDGFLRVHTKGNTDRIVGMTIVAPNAGDLIAQAAVAMTHGLGLKAFATTIHPYPTVAEGYRKLGDRYNAGRLKPWVKSLLGVWFGRG